MKAGTVGEGTIGSNAAGMNAIPAFGSNQSNANSPNHRLEQAQKVAVVCQIIVAGVCISFALYFLEPVLVPLVLATFFSQAMQPLLAFLTQRTRLPSSIAVFFAMLTLCGSFIAVIFATIHSVRGAIQNARQYESYVVALARKVTAAQDRLGRSKLGKGIDAQNLLEDIPIGEFIARLSRWTITGTLALLARLTLVIIFVLYLLSPDGGKRQPKAMQNGVWSQIQRRTQKFVSMKLLISSCTGMVCGTVYYVLGVQLWHAFAAMHIIFSLIPNVGAIIACLLPIPVVAVDDAMSPVRILLAFALPTAAHLCVGYFVEPQLLGDCLNLHPVTVLASLAFWGVLWGIPGMLLACPLTSAIRVLLASTEVTQPFAEILAGNVTGAGAGSSQNKPADHQAEDDADVHAHKTELERAERERPAAMPKASHLHANGNGTSSTLYAKRHSHWSKDATDAV